MGGAYTELEENAPAGTIGRTRSRIYRKAHKGGDGTELEENTLPGASGVVETDFIKKITKRAGTELVENPLAGASGRPRSRIYRKTNKGRGRGVCVWGILPRSGKTHTHFQVLAGAVAADFIRKPIKRIGYRTRGKRTCRY